MCQVVNPADRMMTLLEGEPHDCQLTSASYMKALTTACKLAAGKSCTIFTDSQYGYGVCHYFGPTWAQRGILRADRTPVTHGMAITDLLHATTLPAKLLAHKTALS